MHQSNKPNHFSNIAMLIGEPARATMLWKIMEGGMHTATELAVVADLSAQNASMHLSKLVNAGLLSVVKHGRMKYYQFNNPNVAYAMEAISNLAPFHQPSDSNGIKYCRTCYDHLAGKVGVDIADKLQSQKIIDKNFTISKSGVAWFESLGISVGSLKQKKRVLSRKCLDWSERRPHLAGSVGAALTDRFFELKWTQRIKHSRMVSITPLGQKKIHELLGLIV
jgi:DNA-binding transcriptional ArsR family regulator